MRGREGGRERERERDFTVHKLTFCDLPATIKTSSKSYIPRATSYSLFTSTRNSVYFRASSAVTDSGGGSLGWDPLGAEAEWSSAGRLWNAQRAPHYVFCFQLALQVCSKQCYTIPVSLLQSLAHTRMYIHVQVCIHVHVHLRLSCRKI